MIYLIIPYLYLLIEINLIIGKNRSSDYIQNESNTAFTLHIGLVNYLRISNLQKLFHTIIRACENSHAPNLKLI